MAAAPAARRRMDPERRREHLLDVASAYIAVHGPLVSLDDIAREAGISPPLMRHYFKNRDGLLDALTGRATQRLGAIFLAADAGDLADRLDTYFSWIGEHQWAHWLWVASSGNTQVPDFSATRRRLAEATVGIGWKDQDAATRIRAGAWVAAIEATVSAWLEGGCQDQDGTIEALLDVAVRLDVVGAKLSARRWRKRA